MSMTKADLVAIIAERADIPRPLAEECVRTLLAGITEALRSGDKVELRGFGSFKVRERDGRRGRNPKTGEAVQVPPKRVPYFKPGKLLRAKLLEE